MEKYPTLFQVNTRVTLTELSRKLGRRATLDDIPDTFLDEVAGYGFSWVYFLSVWQTGDVGRQISRTHPSWSAGFRSDLPDLTDEDICGSGFAITDYSLNKSFGPPESLTRLRDRVHKRGMKLMLDLVPNHTAVDHLWVKSHPEYYVHGTEESLANAPQNYIKVGSEIFAHGRDLYFDGWPDTLQLNYGSPDLQAAMENELARIAANCDGVRCDMAMLVLPDIFERTWQLESKPFWPRATANVRKQNPDFVFMAEVYWDLEWELQQQGFDYTYDKKLYDRLRGGDAQVVRDHLLADLSYQMRSARFLENHDEPRAASVFGPIREKPAALVSFFCPGLRFMHQGQFEGYRKKVSVHLSRRPAETDDAEMQRFYGILMQSLKLPAVRDGNWTLLQPVPAWKDNWSFNSFIAYHWSDEEQQVVVAVNYSGEQSQCYLPLPQSITKNEWVEFRDMLGQELYRRNGEELVQKGLYLDLPAWGYNVFVVEAIEGKKIERMNEERQPDGCVLS